MRGAHREMRRQMQFRYKQAQQEQERRQELASAPAQGRGGGSGGRHRHVPRTRRATTEDTPTTGTLPWWAYALCPMPHLALVGYTHYRR